MAKAPTDAELDAWMAAHKITSTAAQREYIWQVAEDLKAKKISEADARKDFRMANAVLVRLRKQIRG